MYIENANILETAGSYKAAQQAGLHDALRKVFWQDADNVMHRFCHNKSKLGYTFTRWLTCSLFRGERAEGKGQRNPNFGCVDSQRIKAYLNSHPAAFDMWLNASMATLQLPYNSQLWRRREVGLHSYVHRAARDVIAASIMVFTR
jgi:hypothetical protein